MKPKLSLRAFGILKELDRDGLPWMFQKDLPFGYPTGDGFHGCAKHFPDGFAPVILRGARCRLFGSRQRAAVEALFDRAIRMHKVTVLSTDRLRQGIEARKRDDFAWSFTKKCREKWDKRYPSQRFDWWFLAGTTTYILGKRIAFDQMEAWEEMSPLVDGLSLMERKIAELSQLRERANG